MRQSETLKPCYGEISLIMIGILLALQVGEWNQTKNNHKAEHQILTDLKEEFETNRNLLEEVAVSWSSIPIALEQLLSHFGTTPKEADLPSIRSSLNTLLTWRSYDPRSGRLNSAISSDNLALIENREIRSRLAEWPDLVDDLKYNGDEQLNYYLPIEQATFEQSIALREDSSLKSDLGNLYNNIAAENYLVNQQTAWRWLLEEKDEVLKATDQILNLIEIELKKGSSGISV